MKKALFKPNTKIGENFEQTKFNEMLIKKIIFFYKTYIRHLKKTHNEADNNKIYELIKKDVEDYNQKSDRQKYELTTTNLSDNVYEDSDIKLLMILEFFRTLGGRNPFMKTYIQDEKFEMFLDAAENQEEEKNETTGDNLNDYLTFGEIPLKDRLDTLFFFCNYALTFSGRATFFKEEVSRETKDPINSHIIYKRNKPLGSDWENKTYYFLESNRDCRIYKETSDFGVKLEVKNYEELEKFIDQLESHLKDELANKCDKTKDLIKNLKEHLIRFKENSEEEAKREANFIRKQQAFEKAKKLTVKQGSEVEKYKNSDYFLMNVSDHVITRNQLNRITRTSLVKSTPLPAKTPTVTEDDKKKIKIEKEKLERERRLEKRNKMTKKLIEYENSDGSLEEKEHKDFLNHKRDRKQKTSNRKRKHDSSDEDEYLSSEGSVKSEKSYELKLDSDKEELDDENAFDVPNEEGVQNDIILEGNLIYRYTNNQIELDGHWMMSADNSIKEKLSFLFQNSNDFVDCLVTPEDSESNEKVNMKICAANLFELITIGKLNIFEDVLNFLSGEYAGYFMYYGKTIEDRANLTFSLEDSLVRVTGEGTNNLGNFSLIGYMNFYRQKEVILEKNDIDSEVIKLSEFKLTKIYTAFNPNENYRVIKSYQHRRKKIDEDYTY